MLKEVTLEEAYKRIDDLEKAAMEVFRYLESTLPDGAANDIMKPFDGLIEFPVFHIQEGNYTTTVTFTSTDNYGTGPRDEDDVYTVEEFKAKCEFGAFIDYDGHGYPVKDSKADRGIIIKPSKLSRIPMDATHIVWYNR